jgi:hypothetical protein
MIAAVVATDVFGFIAITAFATDGSTVTIAFSCSTVSAIKKSRSLSWCWH